MKRDIICKQGASLIKYNLHLVLIKFLLNCFNFVCRFGFCTLFRVVWTFDIDSRKNQVSLIYLCRAKKCYKAGMASFKIYEHEQRPLPFL